MNSPTEPSLSSKKNPDELIADISKLMAEAEEMLSESTSHHAEEKIELLRSRHENTEANFAARYAATKAKIAATAWRTDQIIRANPYESVVAALGLGVLVGLCFSRREE